MLSIKREEEVRGKRVSVRGGVLWRTGRGEGRGRPEARGERPLRRREPNLAKETHATLVDESWIGGLYMKRNESYFQH